MAAIHRVLVLTLLLGLVPLNGLAQDSPDLETIRVERLKNLRERRAERKKMIIERRRERERLKTRPQERIGAQQRQREDRKRKRSLEGLGDARRDVSSRPFRKAKLESLRIRREMARGEDGHMSRQARLRRVLEVAKAEQDNALYDKAQALLKREDRLWSRLHSVLRQRLARGEKLMERTRKRTSAPQREEL